MNPINNPAGPSLRVSGLALLGTNVIPAPPHPPATWRQQWSNAGINDFSFADEYASLLISSPSPKPPFFYSSRFPLSLFFTMCSEGERPATPLRWVALKEEKKRGRKIRPGTSPNEQINASVPQETERVRKSEREAIGPGQNTHTEAVTSSCEWESFLT